MMVDKSLAVIEMCMYVRKGGRGRFARHVERVLGDYLG